MKKLILLFVILIVACGKESTSDVAIPAPTPPPVVITPPPPPPPTTVTTPTTTVTTPTTNEFQFFNIIGSGGVKVYQFDSFYKSHDSVQTHGERVYNKFIENISVETTVYQVDSPNFDDTFEYIFSKDEIAILTQSASNRLNEDQYEDIVRDNIELFKDSNILWFKSMENSGDDGQDYTHGVYSHEIITTEKGLDRTVFIASYQVRPDGHGIIGNIDLDWYDLYEDEILFFEEISTSFATPKAAALGAELMATGYTPVEIKQMLFEMAVEQEVEIYTGSEWIIKTVKIIK